MYTSHVTSAGRRLFSRASISALISEQMKYENFVSLMFGGHVLNPFRSMIMHSNLAITLVVGYKIRTANTTKIPHFQVRFSKFSGKIFKIFSHYHRENFKVLGHGHPLSKYSVQMSGHGHRDLLPLALRPNYVSGLVCNWANLPIE